MCAAFADNPEFNKLLDAREGVDLVRLMLEFAGDAYPGLDARESLAELDQLGRRARDHIEHVAPHEFDIERRLQAVSDFLRDEEGFRGNSDAYYDPRNSYINDVLGRRLGIPISLAIIYAAVGRRTGLALFGVGTPGHFVVGCESNAETLYLDPFSGGEVLGREACQERIEQMLGERGVLTDEHFRPATTREIAARVLRNLKAAHAMANDWAAAVPVQLRLTALLPDVLDERRDLGLIYLRSGAPHPAVELLAQYVETAEGEAADAVRPFLKTARRLAAEMN
ncbi:MAG: transglutaminase family protein [Planctomycetia bacterium]|nr:transglutaminase family protein [Planctomycetia bacterium]